jgi:hypothetical protein
VDSSRYGGLRIAFVRFAKVAVGEGEWRWEDEVVVSWGPSLGLPNMEGWWVCKYPGRRQTEGQPSPSNLTQEKAVRFSQSAGVYQPSTCSNQSGRQGGIRALFAALT